jgi:transposase
MKAHSIDLRERVLAALERGMARASVAETFQVSEGSIKRYVVRLAALQRLVPNRMQPRAHKLQLIPMQRWPSTLRSGMPRTLPTLAVGLSDALFAPVV